MLTLKLFEITSNKNRWRSLVLYLRFSTTYLGGGIEMITMI